jgi:hypothetical protein
MDEKERVIRADCKRSRVGLLFLLLLTQGLFLLLRSLLGNQAIMLKEGVEISFPISRNGVELKQFEETCTVGFLCTNRCVHCALLASEYADSLGSEGPVWFVAGTPEDAETFRNTHGFRGDRVVALSTKPRGLFGFGRPLRVPITPLRLVVGKDFQVLDMSTAKTIPTGLDLARLCSPSSERAGS